MAVSIFKNLVFLFIAVNDGNAVSGKKIVSAFPLVNTEKKILLNNF